MALKLMTDYDVVKMILGKKNLANIEFRDTASQILLTYNKKKFIIWLDFNSVTGEFLAPGYDFNYGFMCREWVKEFFRTKKRRIKFLIRDLF